jgi:poly(3-hydroxyoctanoate) depolymerase
VTSRTHTAGPRDGLLGTGGLRVATRTQGTGSPLLLLNGLTRPLDSWAPFVELLPSSRVVTFDVPGVGASPTPALPLSIPALARIASEVLDASGVESVDVLGFSHGGLVAQQLALVEPERVRTLVLVSTSCGVGGTLGPALLRRSLAASTWVSSWPAPDPMAILWQVAAVGTWSSIPFLGAIRQPTLVVHGAHDQLVPPENGQLLARRIPAARLVTLPAGHDLQRADRAHLLAGAVRQFLRDLP